MSAADIRPPFGARLERAMADGGNLCVGIDPHPQLLNDWGLDDSPAGLETFSLRVVSALAGEVAVLKPQVALFERHGSAGIAVLEKTLAAAAEGGTLTLADAKRGDIGSTMAAYADAWLRDGSALAADAVTLSPYLGFESLRPALDLARQSCRGVFVLALTSNPEGATVQHRGEPGSVAKGIVRATAAENHDGGGALGSVGLVVGATTGDALKRLGINLQRLNGPILAPGLGAQGATPSDIKATFGPVFDRVLASTSRGVLQAGPTERDLLAAATAARDELSALRA
ncbi:orotidine-5'-phosphate decarboxylase [Arthrobacter sp. H14]|uniref:orotidine-5'-phosphate decarboxylase n=1 Tax=Arthrobacter sp. H14 TaxID=1312959 RepID=UPI0004B3F37C|nr:orotidine-5'-phosphate decarboxylase [Arthrobacter sp. H14]